MNTELVSQVNFLVDRTQRLGVTSSPAEGATVASGNSLNIAVPVSTDGPHIRCSVPVHFSGELGN